jgi:anti-sigma regulatory factor (Ser/Thr protein kinase)
MHKGHDTVTSAQAQDLTYGSRELRPIGNLRRPATVRKPTMVGQDRADYADLLNLTRDGQGELLLIPGPESVKAARDFTAATLRGWKLESLVEEAVIVASELVTNAIRHGTCPAGPAADSACVMLTWQRHDGRIICVVTDGSNLPPVLEHADMNAESGRGLQVVHALAAAWGWVMLGACEKAVWAAFQLP